MAGNWRWSRIKVSPANESTLDEPLHQLFDSFAPDLLGMSHLSAVELCEASAFSGRLVWIDGLGESNCNPWKVFLQHYAQVSRSVSRLVRTLFVAPVGLDTWDVLQQDVALTVHEWADVVDEMDLVILANDRLRGRGLREALRKLLVMTIAKVAAWDCAMAERLAEAKTEDILDPLELLRSEARKRGWNHRTLRSVSLGTVSVLGIVHAALAAIREPDEIRSRIWSAQVSVLLPIIEIQRRKIVRDHYHQIKAELGRCGRAEDPETLEIGDLAFLFRQDSFDQRVRFRVERLRLARNDLAHSRPLLLRDTLHLVEVAAEAQIRSW